MLRWDLGIRSYNWAFGRVPVGRHMGSHPACHGMPQGAAAAHDIPGETPHHPASCSGNIPGAIVASHGTTSRDVCPER